MQVADIEHERCIGCGVCVDICLSGALTMKNGKIYIEDRLCTGCGDCVEMCPEGAIQLAIQAELAPAKQQTTLAPTQCSPAVIPVVIAGIDLLIGAVEIAMQAFGHRSSARYPTMPDILSDGPSTVSGRGRSGRRRRRRRRGRQLPF
jgi:Fe-S-cluster-containing hydrogenase component 2